MDSLEVQALLEGLRELGNDHSQVEAKKAKGGPPARLWETLSAFANSGGGVLLLGVHEAADFRVTGVDDPASMERHIASLCSNDMEPPIRAVIESISVEGKYIVVVEVPALRRSERPCYYRGAGPYGGSYIRVSDGDRRLTNYEVAVLIADRGQPREDERPVVGATVEDLDPDLVQGYLRRLRRDKPRLFAAGSEQDVLRQTKVLVAGADNSHLVPSVAGLLALGDYPQSHLPQVNLTFVNYPTSVRGEVGPGGERFLDNASFDGPIPVIADEAMARLRQRMSRRSIVSGVARRDVYEYPEEAIREALVNALAHRDLSAGALGTQVQVEMFPDRLEVRNPGGLHGPVGVEDLATSATSSARNACLYKILEYVPLPDGTGTVCENRGSGIKAMIVALRAAGMSLPKFSDNIASFQVTFPNATLLDEGTVEWLAGLGQKGLTDSQVLALARMRHGETLKNATYREETGVDSRVATTELKDLVARGIVAVEGVRGGATYQITEAASGAVIGQEPLALGYHGETPPTAVAPVPEVARDVWDGLASGPRSRGELEELLGLEPYSVLYRLRLLRSERLVEIEGSPRSPKARWRRIS